MDSITQDFDTAVTAPADPTRVGYTFAGWSPALPGTMPAGDMTVVAQWTMNSSSSSITLVPDYCPDGDFSPSYYDGTCGTPPIEDNTQVEIPLEQTYDNKYSQELKDAYLRALSKGITTKKTITEAELESPLIKSHMAKMVSEYAKKVLDKQPDTSILCEFTDIESLQGEDLYGFVIEACQL